MRRLTERMNMAKTILRELNEQPLTHKELEMRTILRAGSHGQFEGMLKHLYQSGFIKKEGSSHISDYKISDKGKKFLEATK